MVQQREHDALVLSYRHLPQLPRADEALHTLKKIASLVKPIMRARGWKVTELCEFYPQEHNLLGLNVNKGQKILLRLRYPGDKTQFLPIEQVTDTMLHELSHIVHGPHDAKFHALWDQLRDEHEGLVMKGYTGEGFLSKGHKLGGSSSSSSSRRPVPPPPPQEARRLARAAAEQRARQAEQYRGSGQRLGGAPLQRGADIRQVITGAVERRNAIDRGCGSTNYTDREIATIAETATKNGFRTQAEEDAANEAAIAQALWELVQEDEKRRHGDKYIPPSAEFPAGNGGGAFLPDSRPQARPGPPPVPEWSRPVGGGPFGSAAAAAAPDPTPPAPVLDPLPDKGWTCEVCTLHNPPNYLSCDACGSERSEAATKQLLAQEQTERAAKRTRSTTTHSTTNRQTRPYNGADLTHSRMVSFRNSSSGASSSKPIIPPAAPSGPAFWECSRCGNVVERQWWSCAQCGNVKEQSA